MRLPILLVLTLLLAAGCGGGGDGEDGAPTPAPTPERVVLGGGETAVRLASEIRTALTLVGASVEPADGASGSLERLAFPISGGELDPADASGRIAHRGGLRIEVGGTTVAASGLVIDPERRLITAEVDGRRVPLFSATLRPRGDLRRADPVVLEGDLGIAGGGALDRALEDLGAGSVIGDGAIGRIAVRAQRR